MEPEDKDDQSSNPDFFLTYEEIIPSKEKEIETIEINPIGNKANDILIVGIYGNGLALIKSAFFNEMKQSNAFKLKFFQKSKDPSSKKILICELYQITANGKSLLLFLPKSTFSSSHYKNIIDYFKANSITFEEIISFDAMIYKNMIGTQVKENTVYHLKTKTAHATPGIDILPPPNSIRGFSASLFCWADVNDIPCIVYVSVYSDYDIGLDSIRVYSQSLMSYAYLKDKITNEYFSSQKIELGMIKSVFYEFNAIKNSYFS